MGGWIDQKTAAEILAMLVGASNDPRLPKSAAGLASQLKQLDARLTADGLSMTCTEGDKKHSARYTITPTADASPSTNNKGVGP